MAAVSRQAVAVGAVALAAVAVAAVAVAVAAAAVAVAAAAVAAGVDTVVAVVAAGAVALAAAAVALAAVAVAVVAVAVAAGVASAAVAAVVDSVVVVAAAGSAFAPGSESSRSRCPWDQLRSQHPGWAPRFRFQPDPQSLLPWCHAHHRSRPQVPGPWYVVLGSSSVDLELWCRLAWGTAASPEVTGCRRHFARPPWVPCVGEKQMCHLG